jgi:hypothetical protein
MTEFPSQKRAERDKLRQADQTGSANPVDKALDGVLDAVEALKAVRTWLLFPAPYTPLTSTFQKPGERSAEPEETGNSNSRGDIMLDKVRSRVIALKSVRFS